MEGRDAGGRIPDEVCVTPGRIEGRLLFAPGQDCPERGIRLAGLSGLQNPESLVGPEEKADAQE